MKYYVVSDVHGFYSQLHQALEEKGFFSDTQPHKLVICGDLFDRGPEAVKLQSFIRRLLLREEVILVRGNHEDLLMDFLYSLPRTCYLELHHISNGTVDTVRQLTGVEPDRMLVYRDTVGRNLLRSPLVQEIIPAMTDYYETEHYIFVHGWIPCRRYSADPQETAYSAIRNWRHADERLWRSARWINGMAAAHSGIVEPGKTIVCGHWHCSFGHARYEGKGGEFDCEPDFSPYLAPGIIALDACTAYTGKVNCIVIED